MSTARFAVPAALLLLVACGGSSPSATSPTSADGEKKGEHKEHHKEHKELPPALKSFHDDVAPLWHSDKGPERVTKVCAGAQSMRDKATAVGDKELIDTTAALVTECAKKDHAEVEAKFTAVHKQYHTLKERHEK